MPSVIYEDTLSDSGQAIMGGSRVFYVAWEIAITGPAVHQPHPWDATQLLGVGHFELGNDLEPLGLIPAIAFGEPHWLNSAIGQWIVPPGQVGTDFSSAIAQYIRWSLTSGTEVHLYVFGDV